MPLPLSDQMLDFIARHESDSPEQLLLHAGRYPDIDVPFAVNQIAARKHIKDKLPVWYANRNLIFPSRIAAEQCSSEITASYKQQLLRGERVCDLTGGLGIDSWYFAQKAREVIYIERFPEYCQAAAHNFETLNVTNIQILHSDCRNILDSIHADTFYIDPARRSNSNKRLFALNDCEPNVLESKKILLQHSQRLIIKISPMADLTETLRLLPETTEIHILAVKNECKEILFVLENTPREIQIHTRAFQNNGCQEFSFFPQEEKDSPLLLAESPEAYLYEPNSALLKSGAFKSVAVRYKIKKLHQHSHLYTSGTLHENFPGRKFFIRESLPFTGKLLKQLRKDVPQANIAVRNFPMTVEEIRKTSGIAEGGSTYLFATTFANARRLLLLCEKV